MSVRGGPKRAPGGAERTAVCRALVLTRNALPAPSTATCAVAASAGDASASTPTTTPHRPRLTTEEHVRNLPVAGGPDDFDYDDSFADAHGLEAYERPIHDALLGDPTLFTRADGIERLWEVAAPVLAAPPPVREYERGSRGPPGTDELIAPGRWHLPEAR